VAERPCPALTAAGSGSVGKIGGKKRWDRNFRLGQLEPLIVTTAAPACATAYRYRHGPEGEDREHQSAELAFPTAHPIGRRRASFGKLRTRFHRVQIALALERNLPQGCGTITNDRISVSSVSAGRSLKR
jgi:hypothetical protein